MPFIKKIEDFICEKCGNKVKGTGYTNHCPKCFWSKHVDVNPGDRLEECGGLMKPVDFYLKKQEWVVVHECEYCGARRQNVLSDEDDFDEAVRLKKEINEKIIKKL